MSGTLPRHVTNHRETASAPPSDRAVDKKSSETQPLVQPLYARCFIIRHFGTPFFFILFKATSSGKESAVLFPISDLVSRGVREWSEESCGKDRHESDRSRHPTKPFIMDEANRNFRDVY
mmetsp:Transcript_22830/g.91400  ORF Transcript_22830/g.91400 Transcript_22830/m.91400 type:complete len:120 (-) Transcript_22830:1813-2172(-)